MQPSKTPTQEPIPLAKITSPYGVRGWVKVHVWNEDSALLKSHSDIYARPSSPASAAWDSLHIEDAKPHGRGWIIRLQGCDDRNTAEQYLGMILGLPGNALEPLEQGEYYWHQLQGLQVWSGEHKEDAILLGEVQELMQTGANDVMVVMPCADSHNKSRLLIPWVKPEIIREVNLEKGWLRVMFAIDEDHA
jgi:16S rRNA processing protein RimM